MDMVMAQVFELPMDVFSTQNSEFVVQTCGAGFKVACLSLQIAVRNSREAG